jgi:hypothetical protein
VAVGVAGGAQAATKAMALPRVVIANATRIR